MRDPPPALSAALKGMPKYNPREDMRRALQSLMDTGSGSEPEQFEKRMLGAVLGEHLAAGASESTAGPSAASPQSSRASTDSTIACLSSRLAKAEILARALRNQLFKRSRQLSDARRQNAVLMQALDEMQADGGMLQGLCELEQENVSLRSQLHEMETFLADYGLIWVGGGGPGRPGQGEAPSPAAAASTRGARSGEAAGGGGQGASPEESREASVEAARLVKGIKELNRLMQMEDELSTVAKGSSSTSTGRARSAGFQAHDSLPITVFRNGILIRRGPFRTYDTEATQAFVGDVLDGFFPYELKEQFPNGVLFDLVDRSEEEHRPFVPFTGPGSAVGCSRVRTVQSLKDHRHQQLLEPMAGPEFLSALPARVVKGGRIVDVRGGVEKTLMLPADGAADNVTLLETPTLQLIRDKSRRSCSAEEGQQREREEEGLPKDVATLRVLSADGSRSYVMKMRFDSTCFELYQLCDQHIYGGGRPSSSSGARRHYELRTRYPSRALARAPGAETLQDLGLIPNATLLIREFPPLAPSAAQQQALAEPT